MLGILNLRSQSQETTPQQIRRTRLYCKLVRHSNFRAIKQSKPEGKEAI